MISNSEIKFLRSLKQKKFRDSSGLFIVEGEKLVQEALDSDFEVTGIWRMSEIGEEAMSKISLLSSPSPVLATVKSKSRRQPAIPDGLCLALDGVRDPGNMGTVIRLAEWFGVKAVFASPDSVEFHNPKVVQATMGSIFRVPLYTTDIPSLCRDFRIGGGSVIGTFLDGADIYAGQLPEKALIVMGNESNGISAEVASVVDRRVTIPYFGESHPESLNVAVATAVTLAEYNRQIRYKKI